MTNNSFTLGYAHALRDATLSLSGKGSVSRVVELYRYARLGADQSRS